MTDTYIQIQGVVQGVGFRPFVYNLAKKFNLKGYVNNDDQGVNILLQSSQKDIKKFLDILKSNPPVLSKIDNINITQLKKNKIYKSFTITKSQNSSSKSTNISSDIAICKDCLDDINDDTNFRFRYPLTNCTNCGPRYSIIKTIPYDRINTSMGIFDMCDKCTKEYQDPTNRRYHAQPISCNDCGPQLELIIKDQKSQIEKKDILKKTADFIKEGKIVAIKGIGGFHIVCDSTNDQTIQNLRKYKNRPTKPFAIMCKNIDQVEQIAFINKKEKQLLTSKESPIVILNKIKNSQLKISELLAPLIDRIGCFLPYTALHHILFRYLENPILATSANLGSEPIITSKEDILKKLPFIDIVVDFNRDVINAVDDSLIQVINDDVQTLRLARGFSPKVITLKNKIDKNILAVGANAKNSIAIAFDNKIIISPHIGDLDSLKAFEYFKNSVETFRRFYDFEPDLIICDKHPNYETTKWAKLQNTPIVQVQHHLAHIYACKAEFGLSGDYLGFSFDGTGYGDDKTLWGGEVFIGDERKYHFKPIKLLGGSKAIKEPRRVALSMLFEKYFLDEVLNLDLELVRSFSTSEIKILHQSFQKNLNAPLSSSVGRMFDAIASISNILQYQSYEGEAGLKCEQYYNKNITDTFKYNINKGQIDIEFDFFNKDIITLFINTLVKIIVDISKEQNMEVILSGGVFQNKTLLELSIKELQKENIKFYYQQQTAINDGGISLGQIYYSLENLLY